MTKLADMPAVFKTNHTGQISWLDGQLRKNNSSIFLNPARAEAAWAKLHKELVIDDREVEKFMARYLSKTGIQKLTTTLRVAETRAKKAGFKLQCNIEYANNQKLEKLMKATGLKKGEMIDLLIELADLKKITTKETQYEITM